MGLWSQMLERQCAFQTWQKHSTIRSIRRYPGKHELQKTVKGIHSYVRSDLKHRTVRSWNRMTFTDGLEAREIEVFIWTSLFSTFAMWWGVRRSVLDFTIRTGYLGFLTLAATLRTHIHMPLAKSVYYRSGWSLCSQERLRAEKIMGEYSSRVVADDLRWIRTEVLALIVVISRARLKKISNVRCSLSVDKIF